MVGLVWFGWLGLVGLIWKVCLGYAQGLPKACPMYAQGMLKLCPRFAYGLPKVCPRYVQDMPNTCLGMPKINPTSSHDMPKICERYQVLLDKISKTYITANSKIPSHSIFDWVLAWGHPYGGHGFMKQGVFKVYPVSSPQALLSKFPLNVVPVFDLIQGPSFALC